MTHSLKATILETVGSGLAHETTFGNTVCMILMVKYIMNGIPYASLNSGDDTNLIVAKIDVKRV